jgi:RNA polymerase sigma-70 factor (ECF subfamily)
LLEEIPGEKVEIREAKINFRSEICDGEKSKSAQLLQIQIIEITFTSPWYIPVPLSFRRQNIRKMPELKTTLPQHDLIEGCIRNDRRAQESLYKQYCQAMLALCVSYTKNEEDAVEVLQDGFLKIFQQISKFDSQKSTLYTWMRTVVLRTAIDFLRKRNVQPKAVEWDEAHDSSIDAEAIQKMSSQEILHMLHRLTETTRAVFNLYVNEGYTHKEIGELLNISEGTSKWHLSEARKSLISSIKKRERA